MDKLKPYIVPALVVVGVVVLLKYVWKLAAAADPVTTAAPGATPVTSATAAANIPTGTV